MTKLSLDQFQFTLKAPSDMDQALILESLASKRESEEQEFFARLATTILLFKTTVKSVQRSGTDVPLTFKHNGDLEDESVELLLQLTGTPLIERLGKACLDTFQSSEPVVWN